MKQWIYILLIPLLWGCSPQKKLNRMVKKAEKHARKHDLMIQDTIVIIDTLVIESYTHDTTMTFIRHDSVVVINNEKVSLRYFYDTLTREIYHEIECKGDTLIREIPIVVDKIKVVDPKFSFGWKIIIIFIGLLLLFLLFRKRLN